MKSPVDEEIRLSRHVTIKRYRAMERAEDRDGIADFIYERLSERYILPVQTGSKNGFAMMACACLLIETLEAFWKGCWSSRGPGAALFENYFGRTVQFKDFATHAFSFYENVRCGILHQGETKGGWKITRNQASPVLT